MIVTLTPRPDFSPVPRVEISIEDDVVFDGGGVVPPADTLDAGGPSPEEDVYTGGVPQLSELNAPAGTDAITVWWRSQGRSGRVSGLIRRDFAGPVGFLDMEAGFDVPTSYEVECFNGSVSLGRFAIGSTVLPWEGARDRVLVQQPLDPSLNFTAVNLEGSWSSITRGAAGESVRPENESLPRLIGSGPRQGVVDAEIDFGVASATEAARVWETLGTNERPQLQVWLIRAHQGILPRRFFARVGELAEVDISDRMGDGWSRFQASVEEIARPVPALIISPLSYTDLDVSFESYTAMDAAFPSYSARDSAWEYAGASGGA